MKKGFFFTMLSLTVLSIFIVVVSWKPAELTGPTLYSDKAKISVVTSFTRDAKEVYMKRVLYVSSRLAMAELNEWVFNNRTSIDNPELRIRELLTNGTLYSRKAPRMVNQTVPDWIEKLLDVVGENMRIHANITVHNIYVYQTEPWKIVIEADTSFYANYSGIYYDFSDPVAINYSVIGEPDPLYAMNGVNRSIASYTPKEWNASTTVAHIENQTFRYNNWAPGYLMRFQNNSNRSSCCGIESILNSTWIKNISHIDYLYWNNSEQCNGPDALMGGMWNVTEVWDHDPITRVLFDGVHLSYYGINSSTEAEQVCP